MTRNTATVCIAASMCCIVMVLVDGVLQPGYAVKSAIKIALFLAIPLLVSALQKQPLLRVFLPDKKALATGGVLGVATFAAILLAYRFLQPYMDLSAVPDALAQSAGVRKDNFLFVSLYIAFCNSLLEEFFFRGFGFLALSVHSGRRFATLFSATAFAVYHAGMLISMVSPPLFILALTALFLCGLLFNQLDLYRQRIWVSWLVHMGANLAINSIGMQLMGML